VSIESIIFRILPTGTARHSHTQIVTSGCSKLCDGTRSWNHIGNTLTCDGCKILNALKSTGVHRKTKNYPILEIK